MISLATWVYRRWHEENELEEKKGLVVNYHFHRQCNYHCKFCFHTALNSDIAPVDKAKEAMRNLKTRGIVRVNFSGGEPFLQPKWLGEMCEYCHSTLGLYVSIVSNGSNIREKWLQKFGKYVDVLAISCDSFNEDTLKEIGRWAKRKDHLKQLKNIQAWCKTYRIIFKINTVVCSANKDEDLTEEIKTLNPARWKVFQCLLIDGENAGPDAIRDAQDQVVTKSQFNAFKERHSSLKQLVPEDNDTMRNSCVLFVVYLCLFGSDSWLWLVK